jgi:hypothetical protein
MRLNRTGTPTPRPRAFAGRAYDTRVRSPEPAEVQRAIRAGLLGLGLGVLLVLMSPRSR